MSKEVTCDKAVALAELDAACESCRTIYGEEPGLFVLNNVWIWRYIQAIDPKTELLHGCPVVICAFVPMPLMVIPRSQVAKVRRRLVREGKKREKEQHAKA